MTEKLNMSQQCVPAGQKASHSLGCINESVASSWRKGILPASTLLYSTLLRPHQEPFIQLWGSLYMENMDLLEPKEGNENDQKAETSPE